MQPAQQDNGVGPEAVVEASRAPAPLAEQAPKAHRVPTGDGLIRSGRLAGLTMNRAIWVLAWPVLLESFFNAMVGIVDTKLSASLSEAATDAIGVASYVMWLLALVGMAVGIAGTSLVSRAMGKGRRAFADAATGQSILLSLVLGVIAGICVFFGAEPLAKLCLPEGDPSIGMMVQYLWIVAWGVPALSVFESIVACQRGAGDAVRPLWTMIAYNVVNICVSYVLSGVDIFGITNPSPFDMGINGIAAGTLAAWYAAAFVSVFWLLTGVSGIRLRLKRLRLHALTMRRLSRLALPNAIETFGMWSGNFLVLIVIGWMAVPGVQGAHIIAVRIEALSFMPGFAMSLASGALIGQYLGAGNVAAARRAVLRCAAVAMALMGIAGVLYLTIPRELVGVFSQQESHTSLTPRIVWLAGIIQLPFALGMVLRGSLRGAGDARAVMLITWGSTFLVRLPLAWFFSGVDIPAAWVPDWLFGAGSIANPSPWGVLGLFGVWIGLTSELVIRCLFFSFRFWQGRWAHIKV